MATALLLSTIKIGTQEWATKNLEVSTYSDGTAIPQVTDPNKWKTLTTGAWCYYKNNSSNGATYGKLYNWYAVAGIWNTASLTDTTLRKKLAPTGYHIPSEEEFNTLTNYIYNTYGRVGNSMRETGITHWESPNEYATNSSGFKALPSGAFQLYREGPLFGDLTKKSYMWTSTLKLGQLSYFSIESNNDWVFITPIDKQYSNTGFSVRVLVNPVIDPACTFAGNMTVVYPPATTTTTTKKLSSSTTTTTKKPTTTTTTTKKITTTTTTTKKITTTTTTTTKAKICTLAGKASVVTPPVVKPPAIYFAHSVNSGTIACIKNAVAFNASGTITVYSSSKTLIPGISLWQNKELTVPVTVSAIRSVVNCWKLNGNTLSTTVKVGGQCLLL